MKIRQRLLKNLLIIISVNVIIIFTSVNYLRIHNSTNKDVEEMNELHQLMLFDNRLISDFFRNEVNNDYFYLTGNSVYLKLHEKITDSIYSALYRSELRYKKKRYFHDMDISALYFKLNEYKALIDIISNLLIERGFKDYGIEGKMRKNAHTLERIKGINLVQLLMLRRHEKDYIIRNDSIYIEKFHNMYEKMRYDIVINAGMNQALKDTIFLYLDNYCQDFNKLVEMDRLIGVRGERGIKQLTNVSEKELTDLFKDVVHQITVNVRILQKRLLISYLSFTILLIIIGIGLSLTISKSITHPIEHLSQYMNLIKKSGLKNIPPDTYSYKNDEIGNLNIHFQLLKDSLLTHLKVLELKTKEAEEANKTKAMFIAKVSHEIRTPMHGIMGMIQLLKEKPMDEDQQEYIEIINYSSLYLLSIINNILDYSKMEVNELTLESIPMNIREEVAKIIKFHDIKVKSKNIPIKVSIHDSIEEKYVGDPLRFAQILNNLLANAIKFTHQGQIEIFIDCLDRSTDNSYIQVIVKDTGIGMSPDSLSNLFKPYKQADKNTSRIYGGTGLGLSICKELVKRMNGDISVESTENVGTSFTFYIQLANYKEVPLKGNIKVTDTIETC